jgi:glycosyltransferase involved in cell wall biosynthesis
MTDVLDGASRRQIGIWAQWPRGAKWANEGMTRLLAFLIEGIAASGGFTFKVVLPDSVRDAAEQDLRALDAKLGQDFTLHSPRDCGSTAETPADLAAFANRAVPVEGWLALFPYFSDAKHLDAPVTVIFPDAIPKAFPEFGEAAWGANGAHLKWERDVRELLAHANRVITFSDHVAREHVHKLFGVALERIATIGHAPPDLGQLLPFVRNRRRTPESIRHCADILRRECLERSGHYLRDFPFEEVPYIAISTQDRVTKNIQAAARALNVLVRERRQDLKLLMTAPIHFGQGWTVLPSFIAETMSQFDIVSMPDLPRLEHAAFLHCAAVVVHPSIFEGGHAPFPFYEAVSVGTPCLFAGGPHAQELAKREPDVLRYCFDPNDVDELAGLACDVIERRNEVLADQQAIFDRLRKTDWAAVAKRYAEVAACSASREAKA